MIEIFDVGAHRLEAGVALMMFMMPFSTGRIIIVNCQRLDLGIGEQAVGEMAADKPGAAHNEIAGEFYRFEILRAAGPMTTKNKTGRKKMIIGTVSFAGREAAF